MIPDIAECIKVMEEHSMLQNIKAHSIVVTKVAYVISYFLIRSGESISIKKVIAGALLHDIGKTEGLRTGKDHVEIGIRICNQHGFDEISELIAEHVILKKFDPHASCSEKEIIYYSDKRVNHDKIVNLSERLAYIIHRYSRGDKYIAEAIRKNFELCQDVEKKLFKKLPFSPDEIPKLAHLVFLDTKKGLIGWRQKPQYVQ